ncbi:MAG: cation transporter [Planctomycetales bacterium]|nr:cation transporter [Planctomycetales bacterium]
MHEHQHGHDHAHQHHALDNRKRLMWTLILASVYLLAEVIGGWLANSLALMADAGHMLSDVAALGLSWFAVWMATRPAPSHRTYGYYRLEILAALFNGSTIIAVAIYIFIEAFQRLLAPPEVQGPLMMAIAVGGLVVNLAGLGILHGGCHDNLNVRGAWLHVMSDALGSVGAILSGILIWAFGWQWADPVASALIGILLIYSSWRLVKESVGVLMENAPRGMDVDEVRVSMLEFDGVSNVHDLHVWTITSGLVALSAHVVVEPNIRHGEILRVLRDALHDRFGIDHVTIQVEPESFGDCDLPV